LWDRPREHFDRARAAWIADAKSNVLSVLDPHVALQLGRSFRLDLNIKKIATLTLSSATQNPFCTIDAA